MSSSFSSRAPAGVPSNGKYIAVVLLLVFGLGGLLVWKFVISKPDATGPTASINIPTPPPPTTNPKVEDVPPPPPIEEKPDAAVVPKGTVAVVTGGCDAKCNGKAPPELDRALQMRGAQARSCYNNALSRDSTLKGKVSIAVKISSAGTVCAANVASNDMGTPAVAQCVANVFRNSVGLPAPKGGCVEANIPMNFVSPNQ